MTQASRRHLRPKGKATQPPEVDCPWNIVFLGNSGFRVPALSFGAGTFGGKGPLFSAWGNSGEREAQRLVDICLDAGVNLFDTADVYSDGASESILGAAIKGRRNQVILSTKLTLRSGTDPNAVGASRSHLIDATNQALERLGTDYIDLLAAASLRREDARGECDVDARRSRARRQGALPRRRPTSPAGR